MKVLYVTGDSDYSVLMFDKGGIDNDEALERLWNEANSNPNKKLEVPLDNEVVYVTAYELDPKFVNCIIDKFANYDDLKHHNWYIVN